MLLLLKKMLSEEHGLLLLEKLDRKPPKSKDYPLPKEDVEEEYTNSKKNHNGLTLKNKLKIINLYLLNMLNKRKLLPL